MTDDNVDPITHYKPTVLTEQQWTAARPAVLSAVRTVPRLPARDYKRFASRLCRLLAVSAWNPVNPPDLDVLLTARTIDELVTPTQMPGLGARTTESYQVDLRRLGRSIGSIPAPNALSRPRTLRPSRSFWLAVATVPVPLVATAEVYESTGRTCNASMWTGFGHGLAEAGTLTGLTPVRINELTASGVPTPQLSDLVSSLKSAARTLRAASDINPAVVANMATPRPAPRPRKPASASGRARAARAALKAAHDATRRPTAVAQVDLPELDEEVEATIAAYRPNHVTSQRWTAIGPVVLHALRAYRPTNSRWIHNQAGQVSGFVTWVADGQAASSGQELTADLLLEPGLVDRYLAEALADRPDASRATARSILRRVVRNLSGSPRERIGYTPVQAPYTPAECASFVRLARNQPTPDLRRALSAMVALGVGAGLDGGDQREVTPADIVETDLGDGTTGLLIHVRGPRPRTVIVRSAYEPLLREALDLHNTARRGKNTPVYGLSKSRRNVTSSVTGKAVTATGTGVEINTARLRATWLLACMNAPVPLNVLLSAAGLKSARTLTDLLAYCPPASETDVKVVLDTVDAPVCGGGLR